MKKLILTLSMLLMFVIVGCTEPVKPEPKPTDKELVEQLVKDNLKKISNNIEINYEAETNNAISELTIYTVNDFHGALQEVNGTAGAARLGDYLITKRNQNPDGTIVLSAGDMFQGTAISNYRYGLDVINWMNAVRFDAMTLGNHEFDWTLDEILKYRDGNLTNGEANFPFLGANIYQKSVNGRPNLVDDYTIIEKGGLKIGVIGYMGYGLEGDIATSMIADYEFKLPVPIIENIANYLREEKNVDIIIALGHDSSDGTNNQLVLSNARIDAIINGHAHLERTNSVSSTNGRIVPIVQAGSSGAYLGEIKLSINPTTKEVTNSFVRTIKMDSILPENQTIKTYIDQVASATAPLFARVIGVAGTRITNRNNVAYWAVDALKNQMNAEVAFINFGGIRSDALPIQKDENITVSKAYQIMPFDNTVKLVKLMGRTIRLLMDEGFAYSSNLKRNGYSYYLNDEIIDDNRLYDVASIDYIFDDPKYPFINGQDIVATGLLFRDIIIKGIEELTEKELKWIP